MFSFPVPGLSSLDLRQFTGLVIIFVGAILILFSGVQHIHLTNREFHGEAFSLNKALFGLLIISVGLLITFLPLPFLSKSTTSVPTTPTSSVSIATPTATFTPTSTISTGLSGWLDEIKSKTPTETWNLTQPSSDWTQNANCVFNVDGYHVTATDQRIPSLCFNTTVDGATMAFQATFQVAQGDSGGIIWHAAPPYSTNSKQVRIRFGQDGTFDCFVNPGDGSPNSNPIPSGPSALIHQGRGQTNTLTMIVKANVVAIFINGQYQGQGNDTVTDHGAIGVLAAKYLTDTDVVYTSAQFWAL